MFSVCVCAALSVFYVLCAWVKLMIDWLNIFRRIFDTQKISTNMITSSYVALIGIEVDSLFLFNP